MPIILFGQIGYIFSNFSGRSLADTLNSNLLFNLLTPVGTPTYFNKNSFIFHSTIDLVFGSGKFSTTDFVHSENLLGASDPFPIFLLFSLFSKFLFFFLFLIMKI